MGIRAVAAGEEDLIFDHEVMKCPACGEYFVRRSAFWCEDIVQPLLGGLLPELIVGSCWVNLYECACGATWTTRTEYRTDQLEECEDDGEG